MEYEFTSNNFEEEVLKSDIPVLVDFYADWCVPCKMMAPIVKDLASAYEGKIKIGKCNIDDNMETAQKYRVMSIPTFIIFMNGEPVETHTGTLSKQELEDKVKKVCGL